MDTLINTPHYDPTQLKLEIGGVKIIHGALGVGEKFNLYSDGNILASVTLQLIRDNTIKKLMDLKGQTIDYCFNYKDSEGFNKVRGYAHDFALADLLYDKGWGRGRLEYEIIVDSGLGFPLVKFLIIKE